MYFMYLFAQVFSIAAFVHDCDYIMLSNELLSIWINLNDAFHGDCIQLEVKKYVFMLQI